MGFWLPSDDGVGGELGEGKVNLRWVTTGRAVTYGGVLKSEGGGRIGLPLPFMNASLRL